MHQTQSASKRKVSQVTPDLGVLTTFWYLKFGRGTQIMAKFVGHCIKQRIIR